MTMINKIPDSVKMVLGDSNLVGFFARELDYIQAQSYDVKRPPLQATIYLPVDSSAPAGAETMTYRSFDMVGMAKIIRDYDNTIPGVDMLGQEFTSPYRSMAVSYAFSTQEIRAAMMAGTSLQTQRQAAASRATDQLINNIGWFGSDDDGLLGFINNPNIPTSDVPNDGTGSSTKWEDKTAAQVLRDMEEALTEVETTTKDVEMANTLLLPVAQYAYISRTPYSTLSPVSILKAFQDNNPGVTVAKVSQLAAAGTASADIMIAYDRNIQQLSYQIPFLYMLNPPERKGLKIETIMESRVGGVVTYYPLSANIKEGI